jgi:hypothetical protein
VALEDADRLEVLWEAVGARKVAANSGLTDMHDLMPKEEGGDS